MYMLAKMAYRKETTMHIWSRTSPLITCIHLERNKQRSPMVEQSFDIYNISIQPRQFSSYQCKQAQNCVSESSCVPCLDSQLADCISHITLTKRMDISDIRAIIRQVKRPYTTFSYLLVRVNIHKMAYRKATAMRIFGHNSQILACMQL